MKQHIETWGATIIAGIILIVGTIGNLLISPSLPIILGLLTGAVLLFIINLLYIKYMKKDDDGTHEDDELF